MMSMLPSGVLANWILFMASVSVFNTAHCFFTPYSINRDIYSLELKEVTRLTARLFGTWTMLSSFLRLYCAYHMHEHSVYILTMFSFLVTSFHFGSEFLYFKTVAVTRSSFLALTAPPLSLACMALAYPFYFN
ncbi:ergosterol biosynthesis protein [Entomophthora muscae]|uniref:Ergosterol biosynthesis protein n=1 Tax=Entomophthora muscae TaxID=34485 RepID=A0ACC2S5L5_9FUNG|nr:ergosterol biosynthesis protein [Entomophthora muscae]